LVTSRLRIFKLSLCVVAGLLSACASSGSDKQALSMTQAEALGLSAVASTQIPDGWQSLGDPVLDQLIVQALQGQPTLAVAKARVSRMLALAGVSESSSYPQGSFSADVTRQRYTENGLYPPPIAGKIYSSGNVQLGVSWTPDLFGQHTAEIASALNQVQAAQADAAAAALSLAAQVSRGYITLARFGSQREWAQRALAQRQQMFSLTSDRVNAGLDSQLEQRQAEGALLEAQAQAEAVDEQIQLVRHQLAALTGQGPQTYATLMPRVDQLKLEPLPHTLGADLLGRRADVAAARWRVEAATQDVKVAHTQFYPNVSLGAFAGVNAIGLDQLFDNGSRRMGIMPAVRLPLFDGGRLRAQLKGKQGDLDVAIASYNGLVLDAVKEASDAISSSQSLARQHTDQTRSLEAAEAAYRIQRDRFQAGMNSQLALLNAEAALLAQQRARTDVRARELDNRVALMKSLGGGWRAER
jgi:NodT family efflux transporter outer membrane factor (OMF) lipoprotein